jgi:hypothetical protein
MTLIEGRFIVFWVMNFPSGMNFLRSIKMSGKRRQTN